MRLSLIMTTALALAATHLATLLYYGLLYALTGLYQKQARAIACKTPLRRLLDATGTERKVMFLEWMLFGPVGQAFGPANVMKHVFGTVRSSAIRCGAVRSGAYHAILAERYDEVLEAVFQIEVLLPPDARDAGSLVYLTMFVNLDETEPAFLEHRYASWPDATQALMSYYGSGAAERAAVGFRTPAEEDGAA